MKPVRPRPISGNSRVREGLELGGGARCGRGGVWWCHSVRVGLSLSVDRDEWLVFRVCDELGEKRLYGSKQTGMVLDSLEGFKQFGSYAF